MKRYITGQKRRLLGLPWLLLVLSLNCQPEREVSTAGMEGQLEAAFRPDSAYQVVQYLSDRWRLRGGGNRGYNQSIDYVYRFLKESGFERTGSLEVLEGPLTLQPLAWEPLEASITVVAPEKKLISSYPDTPTMLAKYSGSTPAGGVTADLVDVGSGDKPEDYRGKNVRCRIVLGRSSAASFIKEAVRKRGALGVISDRLGRVDYYRDYPDMVLYEALPFGTPEEMKESEMWMIKSRLPRVII